MADNYDSHISILKTSRAKDLNDYRYKEIRIDNLRLNFSTPIKSLDMFGLNKETESVYKAIKQPFILEQPVYVSDSRTYNAIDTINHEFQNDSTSFLKLTGLKPNLYNNLSKSISFPTTIAYECFSSIGWVTAGPTSSFDSS